MAAYGFFAAHLRFIVTKTDAKEPGIVAMLDELGRIADAVEAGREIEVSIDKLRIAARGLAGVASFLQEKILPEVVAAGNIIGERQVRWVIDTSMRMMTRLITRAELGGSDKLFILPLPAPPSGN